MDFNRKRKYALRKTSVALASVLIGISVTGQAVSADELKAQNQTGVSDVASAGESEPAPAETVVAVEEKPATLEAPPVLSPVSEPTAELETAPAVTDAPVEEKPVVETGVSEGEAAETTPVVEEVADQPKVRTRRALDDEPQAETQPVADTSDYTYKPEEYTGYSVTKEGYIAPTDETELRRETVKFLRDLSGAVMGSDLHAKARQAQKTAFDKYYGLTDNDRELQGYKTWWDVMSEDDRLLYKATTRLSTLYSDFANGIEHHNDERFFNSAYGTLAELGVTLSDTATPLEKKRYYEMAMAIVMDKFDRYALDAQISTGVFMRQAFENTHFKDGVSNFTEPALADKLPIYMSHNDYVAKGWDSTVSAVNSDTHPAGTITVDGAKTAGISLKRLKLVLVSNTVNYGDYREETEYVDTFDPAVGLYGEEIDEAGVPNRTVEAFTNPVNPLLGVNSAYPFDNMKPTIEVLQQGVKGKRRVGYVAEEDRKVSTFHGLTDNTPQEGFEQATEYWLNKFKQEGKGGKSLDNVLNELSQDKPFTATHSTKAKPISTERPNGVSKEVDTTYVVDLTKEVDTEVWGEKAVKSVGDLKELVKSRADEYKPLLEGLIAKGLIKSKEEFSKVDEDKRDTILTLSTTLDYMVNEFPNQIDTWLNELESSKYFKKDADPVRETHRLRLLGAYVSDIYDDLYESSLQTTWQIVYKNEASIRAYKGGYSRDRDYDSVSAVVRNDKQNFSPIVKTGKLNKDSDLKFYLADNLSRDYELERNSQWFKEQLGTLGSYVREVHLFAHALDNTGEITSKLTHRPNRLKQYDVNNVVYLGDRDFTKQTVAVEFDTDVEYGKFISLRTPTEYKGAKVFRKFNNVDAYTGALSNEATSGGFGDYMTTSGYGGYVLKVGGKFPSAGITVDTAVPLPQVMHLVGNHGVVEGLKVGATELTSKTYGKSVSGDLTALNNSFTLKEAVKDLTGGEVQVLDTTHPTLLDTGDKSVSNLSTLTVWTVEDVKLNIDRVNGTVTIDPAAIKKTLRAKDLKGGGNGSVTRVEFPEVLLVSNVIKQENEGTKAEDVLIKDAKLADGTKVLVEEGQKGRVTYQVTRNQTQGISETYRWDSYSQKFILEHDETPYTGFENNYDLYDHVTDPVDSSVVPMELGSEEEVKEDYTKSLNDRLTNFEVMFEKAKQPKTHGYHEFTHLGESRFFSGEGGTAFEGLAGLAVKYDLKEEAVSPTHTRYVLTETIDAVTLEGTLTDPDDIRGNRFDLADYSLEGKTLTKELVNESMSRPDIITNLLVQGRRTYTYVKDVYHGTPDVYIVGTARTKDVIEEAPIPRKKTTVPTYDLPVGTVGKTTEGRDGKKSTTYTYDTDENGNIPPNTPPVNTVVSEIPPIDDVTEVGAAEIHNASQTVKIKFVTTDGREVFPEETIGTYEVGTYAYLSKPTDPIRKSSLLTTQEHPINATGYLTTHRTKDLVEGNKTTKYTLRSILSAGLKVNGRVEDMMFTTNPEFVAGRLINEASPVATEQVITMIYDTREETVREIPLSNTLTYEFLDNYGVRIKPDVKVTTDLGVRKITEASTNGGAPTTIVDDSRVKTVPFNHYAGYQDTFTNGQQTVDGVNYWNEYTYLRTDGANGLVNLPEGNTQVTYVYTLAEWESGEDNLGDQGKVGISLVDANGTLLREKMEVPVALNGQQTPWTRKDGGNKVYGTPKTNASGSYDVRDRVPQTLEVDGITFVEDIGVGNFTGTLTTAQPNAEVTVAYKMVLPTAPVENAKKDLGLTRKDEDSNTQATITLRYLNEENVEITKSYEENRNTGTSRKTTFLLDGNEVNVGVVDTPNNLAYDMAGRVPNRVDHEGIRYRVVRSSSPLTGTLNQRDNLVIDVIYEKHPFVEGEDKAGERSATLTVRKVNSVGGQIADDVTKSGVVEETYHPYRQYDGDVKEYQPEVKRPTGLRYKVEPDGTIEVDGVTYRYRSADKDLEGIFEDKVVTLKYAVVLPTAPTLDDKPTAKEPHIFKIPDNPPMLDEKPEGKLPPVTKIPDNPPMLEEKPKLEIPAEPEKPAPVVYKPVAPAKQLPQTGTSTDVDNAGLIVGLGILGSLGASLKRKKRED